MSGPYDSMYETGKRVGIEQGRQEVVEWIEGHSHYKDDYNRPDGEVFILNDWKSKLKEWGLIEEE